MVSGCYDARWLGGHSIVFEGEAPAMTPHGPMLLMMFFDAADCTIIDTWHSTGMRGTGSADFAVEDAFVPEHRTLSVFTAQSRIDRPLYRLRIEQHFFLALANVGLGIARAAIDSMVEIATTKTQTLSQTPMATRPTVHAEIARAEATYQAARAYMHEVAREIEDATLERPVPEATEARRRLACLNAAEASERVVDAMYRLGGTSAIYAGQRLDRCLRDVHTVNQHLAVSPVWWEKTGQFYFGQGLGMP
jgi:alkylation response protein AidB-like acyl-CoA dehydrogenase